MIRLLIAVLILTGPFDNINRISQINTLKKSAKEAFLQENYEAAIGHYLTLVDSFRVDDENVKLNLSHAFYKNNDIENARSYYTNLASSSDRSISSRAFQQLGIIANDEKKYEEALAYFKSSLKANPLNEEARYNYELLKKRVDEQQDQQDQQEQQENQDQNEDQDQQDQENQQENQDQQQQQDQENQEQSEEEQQQQEQQQQEDSEQQQQQDQQQQDAEQQDAEEENKEEQPANPTADRFEEINISEEKARMILEAMKNNEVQYIQQNRRRPKQAPDRSKPDW